MKKKKFWICNQINATTAEILVYGYISPWEISSADFIIELTQLCNLYSVINIRINSGGGSMFEGIAMYNDIMQKRKAGKTINTQCDGIAASMAGILFQAGEKRTISKYGRVMIHRAKGWAEGDADDLRQQAKLIEDAEGDAVKILAEKSGITEDEVRTKFFQKGVDNWIKADQCVEYKFADEVYDAEEVTVPENVTDEKTVYNIFETCLNKASNSETKNYKMKKDLIKKLGLPENATDDQIDSAVEMVLSQKETVENAAKTALTNKAKTLCENAVTQKLITEAEKADYQAKAEESEEGYSFVEKVFAKMQPAKKPSELLNRKEEKESDKKSGDTKTEWEELVAKGAAAVAAFKAENHSEYVRMWETHFKAPFPESR